MPWVLGQQGLLGGHRGSQPLGLEPPEHTCSRRGTGRHSVGSTAAMASKACYVMEHTMNSRGFNRCSSHEKGNPPRLAKKTSLEVVMEWKVVDKPETSPEDWTDNRQGEEHRTA